MKCILTDRVDHRVFGFDSPAKLISTRNLSAEEISVCRERRAHRLFLPALTEEDRAAYFDAFERFWNEVVGSKDSENAFWRNGLSSKMQEWEKSPGYLTLILFTLNTLRSASINIIFVVSSLEEMELIESWGKLNQWHIRSLQTKYKNRYLWRIKQEIVNLRSLIKWSCSFYKKKRSLNNCEIVDDHKKRIMIISRFHQESFKNRAYTDPYWGNMHDVCLDNGYSVTYLFNTVGKRRYNRYQNFNGQMETLFPLSVISFRQLTTAILKVCIRTGRFKQNRFLGCDFSRLLNWSFRKFDHAHTLISEIYFSAITTLSRRSGYEKLLCLFEGNCFERACIQAFNKYMGGTVLSYCHGVIYPINLKIRRLAGELREPRAHHYLCAGPNSRQALMDVGRRQNQDSIQSGCAMRYIPEISPSQTRRKKDTILVALDGVWSTISMLDWLFENEQLFEKYKIILRSHPNVPLDTLLGLCLHRKTERFKASTRTLKEDLSDCFCVVYRQSSVGMQAILHDIPVIHLNIDAPLPCDPILKDFKGKWTAKTADEMSMALSDIHNLTQAQIKNMMPDGKKYVERYFAQSDKQILSKFIERTQF